MWKNFFFAVMGVAFGAYICAVVFAENLSANSAPAKQKTEQTNGQHNTSESAARWTLHDSGTTNDQKGNQDKEKGTLNRILDWIRGFLFDIKITDALLVFFTWVLANKTAGLFTETAGMRTAAEGQSTDMKDSIAQATRAATAMEGVSTSMSNNVEQIKTTVGINREIADRQKVVSEMQLRAYLTVVIGMAIYQERDKGIRFEAKPSVVNTGQTPAYKVRHRLRAKIIPFSEIEAFDFSLPEEVGISNATIGPRDTRLLSAVVEDFVQDDSVDLIKRGDGSVLWVWGVINYKDIFGIDRFTKFSHALTWQPDGKVMGHYGDRFDDSN